ncbi:MAG: LysE family transporter [Chitinophagaceae bacterium]|jgi:threonine/homoserine/homoserine lactone efflux protein|nr:LysE family transporter [Chitinophagaceae bacterium]MBK7679381.1 LysE family transporter [Chitinophagaceae bacterium]MBK8299275.1 LysE family transporter [Chitinophagaceae bacterium]MBK9463326.1 LysE family transporter [Chitinophagaceae bacterium]MBK9659546.1 LysE family transporter [Chitinophagaceae bacterium]
MHPLLKIFFTGMVVSFIGSLPLGTLNIAAMQISVSDGVMAAMLFSFGSLLVEIIYVRISLVAMDWIRKQEKLLKALEWVTLLIVLALAFSSFYAAMHPKVEKNFVLDSPLPKFLLGMVMCAVNPVQIPFWFGWSTVLFTKKVLLPRNDHYNSYIIGIGIGTFIGNCVFIFGGLLIAARINNNQHILNWVVGGIFALTALIQAWRMWRHKGAVHKLEHPEEVTHHIEEQYEKIEEGFEKITHHDKGDEN